MGALSRAAAALALALAFGYAPGLAAAESDWRAHVGEAAARFGLPEAWVLRVIEAESGGRTHLGGKPITSHAGAMGLMQVMPATWANLRARYRLGPDPYDARDNIVAGTAYLREMYDRFGYPGLFAAYNAGPGRYGDYLARRRPLPRETREYVAKITGGVPARRGAYAARDGVRAVAAGPIDPIFLSRRAVPARASLVNNDALETSPAQRAGDQRDVAGAPAESLFLLRKPAPADEP
ncbi:lytic transglycosylase domain-containing protein [Sphingopyxis sp. PAMC25046]|uniref:lytic transglycosylase domain-containing protein n=1 Tax=Sphingopyxis sp. PAMC25046 TaxID=2565556 RepID=UPI00109D9A1C|nr:lytic transglycosylase domain-containing protein [Sphingopyxis sp. PAMC25046]QCB55824.1 lytic transglycosylase domain-containing protein [Sphingopyxis sp. PAMC25046]